MAFSTDDFNKVWASTSQLTPYEFSENNYKEGWNFVGATPPSRQMWDYLQKLTDEKIQYIYNNMIPCGIVQAFAGNTVPDGWLLCDGSAVSRTDYANLYAVIGDTYGAGDGSTTFHLPNMSGRVAIGSGTGTDTNSTSKTFAVGDSDGEYTHKLTVAEMPSHHHAFSAFGTSAAANQYPSGIAGNSAIFGDVTMSMQNTGGDSYHNNIQPYTVLQYIIKY